MSASSTLDNYTDQVSRLIPEELLLGYISWYTIHDIDVELERAQKGLVEFGLPSTHLRERIRPISAWEKASRELQSKLPLLEVPVSKFPTIANPSTPVAIGPDGKEPTRLVRSIFLVREAPGTRTADRVVRHVVLERGYADGDRGVLVYDTVAELIFWRGDKNQANYRLEQHRKNLGIKLTDQEREWLHGGVARLQERFEYHLTHLDSNAIRPYISATLRDLHSTAVRESGGVHFVGKRHDTTLTALRGWVKSIGSDFHIVPLVDMEDQREMLRAAFEDEVTGAVNSLSAEISEILTDSSRSVDERTIRRFVDASKHLASKRNEYRELLGSKLERANNQADLLQRQILQLASRIQVPTSTS